MKKKYIVILVILIAGCGLVIWKWNTWFKNPPETAYTTPSQPDRITLTPGKNTETTRRISWRCDSVLTLALLEITNSSTTDTLCMEAKGEIVASRSGKSAFYTAEIKNLQPGATYSYRVINDTMHSPWYTFHMPEADTPVSFIYIGDVQDKVDGNTREQFESIHRQYPNADFWAFVGDAIERPTDAYWSYWFSTVDSIVHSTPIVAATGNHEYLKGIVKTLDPRWTRTFSYPENGPREFEGRSYFLNFKDICFITLDTDGIQGIGSLHRHYAWLKNVLSTTDKKWKIILMHHPVHSVRSNRVNLSIRYILKPLIEEYGVQLVLQGHDHGYSRITTKDGEGRKGCPVYIVSSCSSKCYPIGFDNIHDRLGSNLSLYQYITVQGDTLHYQSFTTDKHQLYDDLLIIHKGADNGVIDQAEDLLESLELPESYQKNGKVDIEKYNKKVKEREAYKQSLRSL